MERITLFFESKRALPLLRLVRQMAYGDALVMPRRGLRLEYVCPDAGLIHYRLYMNDKLVGVQFVRADHWLKEVQEKLAATLLLVGFVAEQTMLKYGGAKSGPDDSHLRKRKLFQMDYDRVRIKVITRATFRGRTERSRWRPSRRKVKRTPDKCRF